MTIKKLTKRPYANAHIEIDDDGNTYLYSYFTLVVELTTDKWLTVFGLYSKSTRKHISAFMKEYVGTLDYYDAKKAYECGYSIKVDTGEIEELD